MPHRLGFPSVGRHRRFVTAIGIDAIGSGVFMRIMTLSFLVAAPGAHRGGHRTVRAAGSGHAAGRPAVTNAAAEEPATAQGTVSTTLARACSVSR